jgi:hypothetical protein
MAMYAGVGISSDTDSYHAGYEAGAEALSKLGDHSPSLVIAFASTDFDQESVVRGVREVTKGAPLVGCSAAGEISHEGPNRRSVAVMVISGEGMNFTTGSGGNVKDGAREAGRAVARAVKEKAPAELRAFIMFPDVLTGNGADIVRGALDELGEHFPVIGGAAGDDFHFKETFEFLDDMVASGTVVGVGLSGNFTMGLGVRHGWMPIGMPMKVTRSQGAVLQELDGKPAVSIYEDYFDEKADELRREPLAKTAITYPLGLKVPDLDEYLIRDPITVNDDGSITCAAEVPEGSEIRLMIGSKEKAIEAAQVAARKLMDDFAAANSKPKLVLMFNCIAREKLYGQKAKDEISAVRDVIGMDVPMLGFYTYGEQAPLGGELAHADRIHSSFFNETIVMFALGD